jgi:hypothetical protein
MMLFFEPPAVFPNEPGAKQRKHSNDNNSGYCVHTANIMPFYKSVGENKKPGLPASTNRAKNKTK